ncbi:MAG: energy-coupling factor transporter transmembrane component T [Zestosphaera sp.]
MFSDRVSCRVRTIAGYIDRESPFLDLNPLVKLSLIPFAAIYVVFMNILEGNLLTLSVVLLSFKLSKVRLSELNRYLRILVGFLVVIIASYIVFAKVQGSNSLTCTAPKPHVESLVIGLTLYSKILVTVLTMVLMLSITTEGDVVKGLTSLGLDFRASIIVGLVFKFLYYLQIKFEEVRLGELSRGLSSSNADIVGRVRRFLHRFLPLFAITLLKVDEVSDVLELRGFSPKARAHVSGELRLSCKDVVVLSLLGAATAIMVYLGLEGVLQPSNSPICRILLQYSVDLRCPA